MSQKPTYTPATKLYVPEILKATDAAKTVTKPTNQSSTNLR
ncbi:unnamed protein product [Brassica oleracea]|uniref:(rape) hypothetical protein n=1 Tax=Brassica napus TaxID=3708 RepID=A0A816QHN4_BRANA|nr:unnamed protein product [Brassica napus]